jgi:polysaccharide export outer membrane protein
MYKIKLLVIFFAGLIALNSCRFRKDLTLLADMQNDSLLINMPATVPNNILKPDDNLYVTIQSANEEINKLFNVNNSIQGGGSQSYTDPAGQYLYGNLIDMEGKVTLPVLGQIQVAGLTVAEAQAAIQLKANQYIKEATVKVKLLNFKITILGEVKTPGPYFFYDNRVNVFDAVARAGGFTDMARLNTVLVVRPTKSGTQSYRLNFKTKNLYTHPAYYLRPNDMVYAEPAMMKSAMLNFTTISMVLSTVTFLMVVFKL